MDQFPVYESVRPPTYRKPRKSKNTSKQVRKRTVKYLSVCRDPKAFNAVIKSAPDPVIKTICDAALNVQRGKSISLSNLHKQLFRRHANTIELLASKKVPLVRKRKALTTQRGGGAGSVIPLLLGIALGSIGEQIFGRKRGGSARQ